VRVEVLPAKMGRVLIMMAPGAFRQIRVPHRFQIPLGSGEATLVALRAIGKQKPQPMVG
jgi:hypothetical protein